MREEDGDSMMRPECLYTFGAYFLPHLSEEERQEVMKKISVTKKIVICAFMGALSYVLMMLHLPFKYLGFLELEFSDIPALVCTFAYGPIVGAIIEIIKNVIKIVTASTTGGVGELANLVVSIGYIVPCGVMWKFLCGGYGRKKHENNGATVKHEVGKLILSAVVGTVCFVITGILINYFVTVPLYCKLLGGAEAVIGACSATIPAIDSIAKVVVLGITPFNIVKGIALSILGICIYKPFKKVLNML